MKTKFGAIIVAGSGKLGGHVAARNRSGAYMRTRVVPTNPQTTFQQNARSLFSAASRAWSGLTTSERSSWNSATALQARQNSLGDTVLLSGKALFVSMFINLSLIGETPLTLPVSSAGGFSLSTFSVACDNSSNTVIVTYTAAIPSTHVLMLFATSAISPGVSFVKSFYRKISTLVTTDSSPVNVTSYYASRFGNVGSVGSKVHFYAVSVEKASGIANLAGSCSSVIVV
jgi:hypothetical protein